MYERSAISQVAILSVLSVLLFFHSTKSFAQQPGSNVGGPEYRISELKSGFDRDKLSIKLLGDTVPAYTVSERFSPFRLILDIAGGIFEHQISQPSSLIPKNPVASLSVSSLPGQQPITRLEIIIADGHDYTVDRDGTDINIVIAPASEVDLADSGLPGMRAITDFKVATKPYETDILLASNGEISDYRIGSLPADNSNPPRMFIDIPNVSIAELARDVKIGTAVSAVHARQQENGARVIFDSAGSTLFSYDVYPTPDGISVHVTENLGDLPQNVRTVAAAKSDTITDSTLDELIESSGGLLSKNQQRPDQAITEGVSAMQDSFSFSGYKNQRISVDFYKIDIHNVFRLFRQITDLNIIVDEGVQGTVTLALSDVPWDFALDIILNLHDLEKIERYNTIVIYPKKKEFIWPERAMDNLSFEADVQVAEQESLIIEQSANIPEEVMQAKDLIRKASLAEKNDDLENAALLYEQASALWPTNASIYNKISTIYLVQLGLNAKALHYAKEALKIDAKNQSAALNAAIASANMQRLDDASEFFTQAISGNPPMKEALFSFAAFTENNQQYQAALKLLDKYHQYHGETLDTMLAKARILDKIGDTDKANAQYQAIIASGFQINPDLRDYITARLAAGVN